MSEGLAGGDFCTTRLPIRITVYYLAAKIRTLLLNRKMKRFDYPDAKQVSESAGLEPTGLEMTKGQCVRNSEVPGLP